MTTRRMFILLILLSAGSLFLYLPQPFKFAAGFVQAFFLPGLLFTFFLLGGKISRSDRFFLSILISPILLSILVVVGNALVGDVFLSVKIILAACYVLFIVALILHKDGDVKKTGGGVPKQILVLSFVYGGLILLSYLVNGYLLIRSDAWYHAAVVQEVINRGIPPGEPLIADYAIKYMWFYHVFQAAWVNLSGMTLFWALGVFNVVGAFVFPYVIARFVSCFTREKFLILFATLLTVAGLDAAAWVFWPVQLLRAFTGEVVGMEEIRRILAQVSIDGTRVIYFLTPFGTWNINFSDKFLTITVFGYSFNLVLAAAIVTFENKFMADSRVGSSALLFVILLGALFFHVVTGAALLAAIVGCFIAFYLASRYLYRDDLRPAGFSAFIITALIVASIGVAYFMSLTVGGDAMPERNLLTRLFHFGHTSLLTILFPLAVLFIPARAAFGKLLAGRDYRSRILVCWIFCLLIINLFVNIGGVGEKKFIYLLFLLMGPPIFIRIGEMIKTHSGKARSALIAAVIVLFFVPPFLTFRGFIMESPVEELEVRRYHITDEDRRFFDWVAENTPKDAVIIEDGIYHLAPVYAGRRNLYSWTSVARAFYGGEKIALYGEIQASLFGKSEIAPGIIDAMREFEQKLFVAVWGGDFESSPWLAERFAPDSMLFERVYSSDRVSLYTLRQNAPAGR